MHNFKKQFRRAAAILAVFGLLAGLDFLLYPCTYVRNDLHSVLNEEHEDLFLGTSHGKMSIVPEIIEQQTGRSAHNLCVGGEYSVDAYYLARLLAEKNPPKRIYYELDPGYYMTEKEPGNNYLLFYHEFPLSVAKLSYFRDTLLECDFRSLFFPWYEYPLTYEWSRIPQTVFQKWTDNYDVSYLAGKAQEYHESGFIERYPVPKKAMKKQTPHLFSEEMLRQRNVEYLEKLIDFCREKEIELVVLTTPLPADTLRPHRENFEAAWDYFEAFLAEKEVPYLNFNREYYGAFSHNLSRFADYDGHMNGRAAREFSAVLGRLLAEGNNY